MSEPIVEDQPSNGKPEVSNNVDDCSNAVAEFSKTSPDVWINHDETNKFLKILGRGMAGDTVRMRTFKSGGSPEKHDLNRHIALKWQKELNQGVYIAINRGGDKASDITECVALFCEWDDRPKEEQRDAWRHLGLPEPSMQVDSGGKSIHNYWVFENPIDKDTWRDLQERLIVHANSDPALKDPSRVMRLPGCWHFDKKTGLPNGMTTVETTSDTLINVVEMDRILPDKVQVQKSHELRSYKKAHVTDWEPRPYEEILRALDCIPPRVPGTNTYNEHRNALWGLKHALHEIGRDPAEATTLYAAHSPQWKDVGQVARYEDKDAWAGWFWRVASNHGYDLTRAKRQQQRMPSIPVGKDISELTVDDIIGPVEEDKLRNPRADRLRLLMEVAYKPRFNELTQGVEIDGKPVKSTDFKTFYLRMAEELMVSIQKDRAIDALVAAARKNTYHPVIEELNACASRCAPLPDDDWELIAHTVFGAEDPNANMFLQRQLIGLVARVMRPGCKFDTALVIHSDDQGIGKSEFWSIMGGKFFSDSLGSLKQVKDDLMILHRAWIHEWGEIDRVFGKTASENLKHFLTIKEDHFRPPYGGAVDAFPRQCGIVGTTNSSEFIKDPTGNRRYPCFTANKVDLDWVRQHRDAIWVRCLNEYNQGTRYWYEGEELKIISDTAQNFAEEDFVYESVRDYVDDAAFTTLEAVIYGIEGWERFTEDEPMRRRIKTALKRLGYRQSRNKRCPTTCPTLSHLPLRDRKRRPRIWEKSS